MADDEYEEELPVSRWDRWGARLSRTLRGDLGGSPPRWTGVREGARVGEQPWRFRLWMKVRYAELWLYAELFVPQDKEGR